MQTGHVLKGQSSSLAVKAMACCRRHSSCTQAESPLGIVVVVVVVVVVVALGDKAGSKDMKGDFFLANLRRGMNKR